MGDAEADRTDSVCWDAIAAHLSGLASLDAIEALVAAGEALQQEWTSVFICRDGLKTQPPLLCLLPLAHDDPTAAQFLRRTELARRMIENTTYAAEFYTKHLDLAVLQRTAFARTGKDWLQRDPLARMLADHHIFVCP